MKDQAGAPGLYLGYGKVTRLSLPLGIKHSQESLIP
jgi:hypothetical protein